MMGIKQRIRFCIVKLYVTKTLYACKLYFSKTRAILKSRRTYIFHTRRNAGRGQFMAIVEHIIADVGHAVGDNKFCHFLPIHLQTASEGQRISILISKFYAAQTFNASKITSCQFITPIKRSTTNTFQTRRDRGRDKITTIGKCTRSNSYSTFLQFQLLECGNVSSISVCHLAYIYNPVRLIFIPWSSLKRITSNACYIISHTDRGQATAIHERFIAYSCYIIANSKLPYRSIATEPLIHS